MLQAKTSVGTTLVGPPCRPGGHLTVIGLQPVAG